MAKLPDWRRASSSWFSWAAVVSLIADGGWAGRIGHNYVLGVWRNDHRLVHFKCERYLGA